MIIGDQLLKEYKEWTIKYIKAHECVVSLLPPVTDWGKKEKIHLWTPTKELLAEFDRAKKEEEAALAKLHEIRDKLWKLRQKG